MNDVLLKNEFSSQKALAKRLMIFCHLAPLRVAECRLYQMEDSQVRNLVTQTESPLWQL